MATATPKVSRPTKVVPAPKKPIKRQTSGRGIVRISAAAADSIDNPETIEDWDDEELLRGRRKDKHGRFTGRDPLVVPTNVYREITRRSLRKAEVELATNVHAAVETLVEIMTSPFSDEKARVASAKIILERVAGKMPDKIEHSGNTPIFLQVLQGGIVPGEALELPVSAGTGGFIDADSTELVWD